MDLRILGTVELRDATGAVADLTRQTRRLLAMLAVASGDVVSKHLIAEHVVAGSVEGSTVRTAVSRLRRQIGERLVTARSGYRLQLEVGDSLDAARFEELLGNADCLDRSDRSRVLVDALALWRGPALSEFADEVWAQGTAARLDELRCVATENLVETLLELGRCEQAVSMAEPLVRTAPFRERPVALLMQALAGCGRVVDALRAYQRFRVQLVEDIGIEPTPVLRQLEAGLLGEVDHLSETRSIHKSPPPGVVADGLPTRFARLQGELADPGALPCPVEELIGRTVELETLTSAVLMHRLVTATGVGGVGKTALVLAVANGVRNRYPDGVWWVELAPLRPGQEIPATVASVLGVQPGPELDLVGALTRALADQRLLMVLDNCEHVLDSVRGLVETLLRGCAGVVVLATSRHRLELSGEHEFAVHPLRVEGENPPALELLTERVGRPLLSDDPVERAALEEICRRLDGVPLALELAAGRCRTMRPVEVATRLRDRFRILERRGTGADDRSTLRGTVQWSFDLLAPEAQRVFACLSAFAGSFDAKAAERIGAIDGQDAFDVDDALAELVEHSLIEFDGRYRMLETTRAYASEHLDRYGGTDRVRDLHMKWVIEFISQAAAALRTPDEARWVERLDLEWPNVRAAFDRAMEQDDPTYATNLVTHLVFEAFFRRPEALRWCDAAYQRFGTTPHPHRAELVAAAGIAAWALGDPNHALTLGREAVALGPTPSGGFGWLPAWILANALGWADDINAGLDVVSATIPTLDDPYDIAFWLATSAIGYAIAGRPDAGREDASRGVAIATHLRNPTLSAYAGMAHALADLGSAPQLAEQRLAQAAASARLVRNVWIERDIERTSLVISTMRGTAPDDALERGIELGRDHYLHGWLLHAWSALSAIAISLMQIDRPADAALLALAGRGSPAGRGNAVIFDHLIAHLGQQLGPNEMRRLEAEAEERDLAALLEIAGRHQQPTGTGPGDEEPNIHNAPMEAT